MAFNDTGQIMGGGCSTKSITQRSHFSSVPRCRACFVLCEAIGLHMAIDG
eukprot:COSAG01_NODE_5589_length_4160_cov_2.299926_4_plen_50_part_00